jgi:hypothetical protein
MTEDGAHSVQANIPVKRHQTRLKALKGVDHLAYNNVIKCQSISASINQGEKNPLT